MNDDKKPWFLGQAPGSQFAVVSQNLIDMPMGSNPAQLSGPPTQEQIDLWRGYGISIVTVTQ